MVTTYSTGWPDTYLITQASLELMEAFLSQPSKCWNYELPAWFKDCTIIIIINIIDTFMYMKCHLTLALVCICIMTGEVKYLFICSLVICLYFYRNIYLSS